MRTCPRFIETTDFDVFVIEGYYNGRFQLSGTPWITYYDITIGSFYGLESKEGNDNNIVKLDLQPKSPDLYRAWLKSYKRNLNQ